jgi:hypothetical protein
MQEVQTKTQFSNNMYITIHVARQDEATKSKSGEPRKCREKQTGRCPSLSSVMIVSLSPLPPFYAHENKNHEVSKPKRVSNRPRRRRKS